MTTDPVPLLGDTYSDNPDIYQLYQDLLRRTECVSREFTKQVDSYRLALEDQRQLVGLITARGLTPNDPERGLTVAVSRLTGSLRLATDIEKTLGTIPGIVESLMDVRNNRGALASEILEVISSELMKWRRSKFDNLANVHGPNRVFPPEIIGINVPLCLRNDTNVTLIGRAIKDHNQGQEVKHSRAETEKLYLQAMGVAREHLEKEADAIRNHVPLGDEEVKERKKGMASFYRRNSRTGNA